VGTTNNFPAQTPRKLFLGPFQPTLESALAECVCTFKRGHGTLAPLTIVVPTHLLALHLRRALAPHINLHFKTLRDLLPQTGRVAPALGLELLCAHLARRVIPDDGYFAPVRDTKGFATALLATFTDLKEAAVPPGSFAKAAKSKKLRELAAAYTAFCSWLDEHSFQTEADLFCRSPVTGHRSPVTLCGRR
jgi:hypothetical protein